jgi:hypothetical protein
VVIEMAQYDDLIKLGLLSPDDRRNAGLMGLLHLGGQIGARSAPSFSPGGRGPINPAQSMAVYQNALQNSMAQSALVKKLKDQQKFRTAFDAKPADPVMARAMVEPLAERYAGENLSVDDDPEALYQLGMNRGMPAALSQTTMPDVLKNAPASVQALQPYLATGAHAGMGPQMYATLGKALAANSKYRKPKWHNVLVGDDPVPKMVTGSDLVRMQQQNIRVRKAPAPLVKFGTPNAMAQFGIETWKKASIAGEKASLNKFRLGEMRNLLSSGVPTGKLSKWSLPLRNILSSFGVSNPNTGIQEAIDSLGSQLALGQHGPGMGPMTDADFRIYESIVPGLSGTERGNVLVMARLEREYRGREIYADALREQINKGGPASVNSQKAWRIVAKRLHAELGPLIPTYAREADVPASMVGRVVLIGGLPSAGGRVALIRSGSI